MNTKPGPSSKHEMPSRDTMETGEELSRAALFVRIESIEGPKRGATWSSGRGKEPNAEPTSQPKPKLSSSSGREVRMQVPFFLQSILGEPFPKKG